jgi:hypothetical protein
VLARLHRKAPVSAAATSAPAAAPTEQAPSGSSAGGSLAELASSSAPVADGQLASFSRFSSKDPFRQQIKEGPVGEDDNTNPDPTSSGGGSGKKAASGSTSGGSSGSSSEESSSGSSSASASGSAVISVNGTLTTVSAGADFPQPSSSDPNAVPLFHLVSVRGATAKIAIAGGSYTSGAKTVTLRVNKPVTLMNTADGTRYKLVLKPAGTAVPAQSP